MEIVEMDLMQAQIGSLATDVSRLEAKVAEGGGGTGKYLIYEATSTDPTYAFWELTTPLVMSSAEVQDILKNEPSHLILRLTMNNPELGLYFDMTPAYITTSGEMLSCHFSGILAYPPASINPTFMMSTTYTQGSSGITAVNFNRTVL